jgi:hypothetical protein
MLTAFLSITLSSLPAADYSLYGDAALSAHIGAHIGGPQTYIVPLLQLTGNHTLFYEWGEAHLRHRFDIGLPAGAFFGTSDDPSETVSAESARAAHTIYQAAIIWYPTPQLTVQLGRHQLGWGMGQAFSPADTLHSDRISGSDGSSFDGIQLSQTFSPNWTASGALGIDDAAAAEIGTPWWEELRLGGSVSGYLGGLEMIISAGWKPDELFRPVLGISAQRNSMILTLEGAVDLLYDSRSYTDLGILPPSPWEPRWKIAAGMERAWYGEKTTAVISAEFYYDGTGLSCTERDTAFPVIITALQAAAEDNAGTIPGVGVGVSSFSGGSGTFPILLGRSYLFCLISLEYDGRLSTSHYGYINLGEPSAVLGHNAAWFGGESLELSAEASWIVGRDGKSEAALLDMLGIGWSIGLRARVFF